MVSGGSGFTRESSRARTAPNPARRAKPRIRTSKKPPAMSRPESRDTAGPAGLRRPPAVAHHSSGPEPATSGTTRPAHTTGTGPPHGPPRGTGTGPHGFRPGATILTQGALFGAQAEPTLEHLLVEIESPPANPHDATPWRILMRWLTILALVAALLPALGGCNKHAYRHDSGYV